MNHSFARLICMGLVMVGSGVALGMFVPFDFLLPFSAGCLVTGGVALYAIDAVQLPPIKLEMPPAKGKE